MLWLNPDLQSEPKYSSILSLKSWSFRVVRVEFTILLSTTRCIFEQRKASITSIFCLIHRILLQKIFESQLTFSLKKRYLINILIASYFDQLSWSKTLLCHSMFWFPKLITNSIQCLSKYAGRSIFLNFEILSIFLLKRNFEKCSMSEGLFW